jgi:hypothetical protein
MGMGSRPKKAIHHVTAAMESAQPADKAFGFSLHPGKLEAFATKKKGRTSLQQFADLVGPVKRTSAEHSIICWAPCQASQR